MVKRKLKIDLHFDFFKNMNLLFITKNLKSPEYNIINL